MNNFAFNEEASTYAASIKKNYKTGMPLHLPGDPERFLRPEELLNPELDLGPVDNPVILALIAARDPDVSTGLAAAVRMMPQAQHEKLSEAVFTVAGEMSCHRDVRDNVGVVVQNRFAIPVVERVKNITVHKIEDCKVTARETLMGNLRLLINGAMTADPFVEELFQLSHRADLNPEVFKRMIMNLFVSSKIQPRLKLLLIDNLERFPSAVRMEIMAHIGRLPNTSEHTYLKHELEHKLRNRPAQQHAAPVAKQPPVASKAVAPAPASSLWGRLGNNKASSLSGWFMPAMQDTNKKFA